MHKTKHQLGLCRMYGCHEIAVVEVIPNSLLHVLSGGSIRTTLTKSPEPDAEGDLYCEKHWTTTQTSWLRPLAKVYADGDAEFTIRAVGTVQKPALIQAPGSVHT